MDRPSIKTATTVSATVEFPGERLGAFNAMIEEFRAGSTRWDEAAQRATQDRDEVQARGLASLRRLFEFAEHNRTGSSRVIAMFLASIYNGHRFQIDLADLRLLGAQFHQDAINVLAMDHSPAQEIHTYFDNGSDRFERVFADHRLADLRQAATLIAQLGRYTDEELQLALADNDRMADRLKHALGSGDRRA